MHNAVIYARYSSQGQNEQSIEGQARICTAYAASKGFTVVKTYMDKARTGTNDNRPDFQKMIEDSKRKGFQYVLVYQLDRFARNRYDSATYKAKLKKNGVRVLSAKENITDDASGILIEGVLESMAEYYSAELSQKVKRGIAMSAAKCKYFGGVIPLGYKVNSEKSFVLDEKLAPVVKTVFEMFVAGSNYAELIRYLNGFDIEIAFKGLHDPVTAAKLEVERARWVSEETAALKALGLSAELLDEEYLFKLYSAGGAPPDGNKFVGAGELNKK